MSAMPVATIAEGRTTARADWLARVEQALAADGTVAAAWLFGSMAAGTADDLSDVDLFVALADPAEDALGSIPDRLAGLGDLLWLSEDPYNAPRGGRFFTTMYGGHRLPLMADMFWQPTSEAVFGDDVSVLFDRVGVARASPARPTYALLPAVADNRPYSPSTNPILRLGEAIEALWMDIPIAAKHAARAWGGAGEELDVMWSRLDSIAKDLGRLFGERSRHEGVPALVVEMDRALHHPGGEPYQHLRPPGIDLWVRVADDSDALDVPTPALEDRNRDGTEG